jgi:sulfane dehydrogenase subunit SoxC
MVPGFAGQYNVKWLRRIKVVDQPYMTKTESGARPKPDGKVRWFEFEMGPKSVITYPSGGQRLPGPGFYEITGLAWSGGGAIRRVEVSTDGRTWHEARLHGPVHRMAHTRFGFDWTWNGEETALRSRCTDEAGATQPTMIEMGKIWGVDLMDYMKNLSGSSVVLNHWNAIQPWKVNRDGTVRNALF